MDAQQEQKLLEQAKTDPQAFGALYETHYPAISSYCLRRVGDVEVALDITAVTFIKAWQQLQAGTYRWRGVPFTAYLYRIAGNEIISHFRQRRRRPLSLDSLFEEYGLEPISDYDIQAEMEAWQHQLAVHRDFQVVQQLLAGLPLKYHEVVSLRYFEKKSLNEIAAITGKKLNTVKSLLKRGTEKLRRAFSEHEAAAAVTVQPLPRPGVITTGESSNE